MAKLIFLGEKFHGRIYEFILDRTTVGRGADNTLTLPDASVSHAHCEIFVYDEDVIVRDLGSSNGTFVNGERLHNQQRPLKAGQTVKFGTVEARLELTPHPSSDTVTGMTAIHAFVRHQAEPLPGLQPLSPSVARPAESRSPSASDHTLLLPRPPAPDPMPEPTPPPSQGTKMVLALAVLGLVAMLVIWLILRQR